MNIIQNYIHCTRILHPQYPSEVSQKYYEHLQTICWDFAARFFETANALPSVNVTYSLNRAAEITTLGAEMVLVYDQFLGQTFNTFHRLYLFGRDWWHFPQTISKMMSEEAACQGRAKVALFYVGYNMKFNGHEKMKHVSPNFEAATDVALQELFVFAHEYCHLLMRLNVHFETSRRTVAEIILEETPRGDPERIAAGLKARYGEIVSADEIARVQAQESEDLKRLKPVLEEETACDDFALFILIEYCKRKNLSRLKAFQASFLALRNIRAFNYLKEAIGQIADHGDVSGVTDRVKLLQFRQKLLRNIYPMVIGANKLNINPDILHRAIGKISDQHDERIDNKILFDFLPRTSDEFETWDNEYKLEEVGDFESCLKVIKLLGWGGEPVVSPLSLNTPRTQPPV